MTVLHKILIQDKWLKVYEFTYTTRPDDNITDPTFLNNLESAYNHAIALTIGNQTHSIYSSHTNGASERVGSRIVIVHLDT